MCTSIVQLIEQDHCLDEMLYLYECMKWICKTCLFYRVLLAHLDTAFFIITLFAVYMLLACGRHLHDSIISLRGEGWTHKTSLTPPHFIEVPVSSHFFFNLMFAIIIGSDWNFCLISFYVNTEPFENNFDENVPCMVLYKVYDVSYRSETTTGKGFTE